MDLQPRVPRKRRRHGLDSMGPELILAGLEDKEAKRLLLNVDAFIGGWGVTAWGGTVLDPTGKGCWFAPTRGSSMTQRTGLRCHVVRIQMSGIIQLVGGSTTGYMRMPNVVELALVLDHQTNGQQCVGTDVFWQGTLPGVVNYDNAGRFTILKRQLFEIKDRYAVVYGDDSRLNICYYGGECHAFRWDIDCNIPLDFVAGAGTSTVADLCSNSIHVLGTALNQASATVECRMSGLFFFYG